MPREGFVQKAMMGVLSEHNNLTLEYLAAIAFDTGATKPTANQLRAARFALKRLLQDGKVVESPYRDHKGDRCFSLPGGARRSVKAKLTAVK